MSREELREKLYQFKDAANEISDSGFGAEFKITSALLLSNTMIKIIDKLDTNPYQPLFDCLDRQIKFLTYVKISKEDISETNILKPGSPKEKVKVMYENIWTIYDRNTYAHSVELMEKRLLANGLDKFFKRS